MASTIQPYPEISSVLTMLHGRLPMAVFTGASSQAAHMLLKETGLLEHFGVVVAGDQVDRQKPHPDGVLRACERLGVPAQAAAYVADAPIDLEAAPARRCASDSGRLGSPAPDERSGWDGPAATARAARAAEGRLRAQGRLWRVSNLWSMRGLLRR
jgi:beta-phosphoglucomutase-like phosphatase (HAD superfamily)